MTKQEEVVLMFSFMIIFFIYSENHVCICDFDILPIIYLKKSYILSETMVSLGGSSCG